MTTTSLPAPVLRSAPRRPAARDVLAGGVGVGLALFLVALGGLALDSRTITGAPAWLKPAKFGISVAVYLATLRWMLDRLPGHARAALRISWAAVVILTAELAWISLQVVRGRTSHYDVATTLDAAMYYTMGLFISGLVLVTLAVGVLALRVRGGDAGLAAGVRWGIGVCLVGMLEAVTMTINDGWNDSGGHTVGAPDGGPGLPLTGWSTLHGDLRIGHFVGLHGLQVLPLLAWVLVRRTGLDAQVRARLVAVAGSAWIALVALLAWQALRGQALLRPDAVTLSALGVLVLMTAGAAGVVLRRTALCGAPEAAQNPFALPARTMPTS